jgi:hypothetical protein
MNEKVKDQLYNNALQNSQQLLNHKVEQSYKIRTIKEKVIVHFNLCSR